jgi:hypothetical protein
MGHTTTARSVFEAAGYWGNEGTWRVRVGRVRAWQRERRAGG